MLIFAFDISFNEINLALNEDRKIISEKKIPAKNNQSEILVAEIKNFLNENNKNFSDIDLIVSTKGPASFTSIRISLTVAKIIQLSINKPLILFSSLEALMLSNTKKEAIYLININSRIDEFYFALYRYNKKKLEEIIKPKIFNNSDLQNLKKFDDIFLIGDCSNQIAEIFSKENLSYKIVNYNNISSAILAEVGFDKFSAEDFQIEEYINNPALYLSEPNITKKICKKDF
jgi:tRNA threonylcarbamoyl adenosine modification protein YeaZ